jgi:inosose dehydratase
MQNSWEIKPLMPTIEIGCGQITWSRDTPEEQVLAEIAQAGYAGAPAGPSPGRTAEQIQALYARHNLKPAPGYLGAEFWRADQRAGILDRARQYARLMRELGCSELYVAAGGFDSYITASGRSRRQLAGHVGSADAMTGAEYQRFADALSQVGEITLTQGVRSCFHNHVGSVIETREEIDRLLSLADPALVFLGPDTGHLAWAGADPVAFCRDYASRIKTIHVKDVDAAVCARGREQEWDYNTFTSNGIFAELGQGSLDFPAIFTALRGAGFSGWAIAETDVTQKPTALESATISRAYLRGIGL